MCSAPSIPKPEKVPVRQAGKLPDNGDATLATANRERRRLGPAAMVFASKGGTLGAPSTTNALGV